MSKEHFGLPVEFDGRVRLFPLPNHVVFPHTVQSLHIFESRYCEMLLDAMASDELIAMATLQPNYEYDYFARPPIHPVVCLGRVIGHEPRRNETHDLLLAGLCRARIEEELPPMLSYREARVELLKDTSPPESPAVTRLREPLIQHLQKLTGSDAESSVALPLDELPLCVMTDVLAHHLPLATNVKLGLLKETNVISRAELIATALPSRRRRHSSGDSPYSLN